MPTAQPAESLLQLLEKSRLISDDELSALVERLRLRDKRSGRQVARALVAEGRLTRYQANRLLAGRYRGFFIDHYTLLEVLGTGGMGRLFLAEDGDAGERVALKVLSERYQDDAGMLARLQLEARAGQRLNHPNVVRTYGLKQSSDGFNRHYIAMEFVRGIGVEELIQLRGARPWSQASDIVMQAAAGLQHAHERGLVHRDLKPGNLLIDHEGIVKVVDFGLALIHDRGEDEFSLNMIFGHDCVGSADYMAPEQAADCSQVDARADIYGLGCTFYAILAASLPFPGVSGTGAIKAHATEAPRPIRERVPDVPEPVAAILEKMMARRPEERFRTAGELQKALEPFAQRMPVDFDFDAILAARAEEAKRKARGTQRRETRPRTSTTVIERHAGPVSFDDIIAESRASKVRHSRTSGVKRPIDPDAALAAKSLSEQMSGPAAVSTGSSAVPAAEALLIPQDGGAAIPLAGSTIVIGRSSECDVRLTSSRISSRHCELRHEGNWWRVIDLGSKNGTRVNGVDVKDQMLWPGDVLTLAEFYRFRLEGPARRQRSRKPLYIAIASVLAVLAGLVVWLLLR